MLESGSGGGTTNSLAAKAAAERARLAMIEQQKAEAAREEAARINREFGENVEPSYQDDTAVIDKDTFVSQAQIEGKSQEDLTALYDQYNTDGQDGLTDAEFEALYAAAEEPEADPAEEPETYKVKGGDTLSKIAKKYTEDPKRWQELYELNKDVIGDNPNLIHPGQELKIPPSWLPEEPVEPVEPPANAELDAAKKTIDDTKVTPPEAANSSSIPQEARDGMKTDDKTKLQASADALEVIRANGTPEDVTAYEAKFAEQEKAFRDAWGENWDGSPVEEAEGSGGDTGSGGALTPEQTQAKEAIDATYNNGLPKPGSAVDDNEARRALNGNVTTLRDHLKKLEGTPDYEAYKAKVDEYAAAVTAAGKPAEAEAPEISEAAKKGEELVAAAEADPWAASQWTPEQQVQVQRYAEHQAALAKAAYDKGDLAGVEQAKANLERTINATYNAPAVQQVAVSIAAEADLDAKIQDLKVKAGDDEAVKDALGDADKNDPASYKRVADMLPANDPRKKVLELMADPNTTPNVRDELRKALEDNDNTDNDIEDAVRNAKTPADAAAIAAAMRAKDPKWEAKAKVMDALANDKISEQVRTKLQHAVQDSHGTWGDLSEAFKHASSPEDFAAIAAASGVSGELAPFADAVLYGKASPEVRQELYLALKDNTGTRDDINRMLGKARTAEDFDAIAAIAAAKGADYGDLKVLAQTRASDLREQEEEAPEPEPVRPGGPR